MSDFPHYARMNNLDAFVDNLQNLLDNPHEEEIVRLKADRMLLCAQSLFAFESVYTNQHHKLADLMAQWISYAPHTRFPKIYNTGLVQQIYHRFLVPVVYNMSVEAVYVLTPVLNAIKKQYTDTDIIENALEQRLAECQRLRISQQIDTVTDSLSKQISQRKM